MRQRNEQLKIARCNLLQWAVNYTFVDNVYIMGGW